ncbi:hypothetical protein PENTCL1PPCAC_4068 [Pristionchus entomophagus]|uniref:G protein-coupled receptor n=1 Tax=Pristionchus entomophagus TaxID=358040 RepID=A0AAV5SIA6_9BILA|nr:hypothetical protein PENTCL1PPCAC_4068 [Pristionchus entomophagus]
MIHGHAHYCIMLAVCFSFRYYVMLNQPPSIRFTIAAVIVIYLPTAIIFYLFSQTPIFDPAIAREILDPDGASHMFPSDVIVTGVVNIFDPYCFPGLIWICAPCVPCYMVIQFVGRLMYRSLAANISHMSDKTRSIHREILQGLICQACLPAFYSFGITLYIIRENIKQGSRETVCREKKFSNTF